MADEVPAKTLEFPSESDLPELGALVARDSKSALEALRTLLPTLVYNEAALEGNPLSLVDVREKLISRAPADGDFDVSQVYAIADATWLICAAVLDGTFAIGKQMSDSAHKVVGEFEALDAGMFRGEGATSPGGGAVNAMGLRFRAPYPGEGGGELRRIYDDGVARLAEYVHPATRAVSYAAFATYNQFYFDANKRTSRLMMNGALMSAGYDAIVTPAARKLEYNQALRQLFEHGDMRPYMHFLLSCYDG